MTQPNTRLFGQIEYEPATSRQHASEVYVARFGKDSFNGRDIEKVIEDDFSIPDHDLLVGGFPCQDYSVTRVLSNSRGLIGKVFCFGPSTLS